MRHADSMPADPLPQVSQIGAPPRVSVRAAALPQPHLRSDELFRGGHNEVLIEHRGDCYRLRLTRQGKLILNK